jgi:FHA domain-containing protein
MRGVEVELVHISGSGRIEPKAMAIGEYVLGRERGCSLRVPSSQVSRKHCVFQVSEVGISVKDLGSSNGTWVNAERVDQTHLSAGDLVAVGPTVFVVRIDGTPESIDPVLLYEQGRPRVEETPGIDAGTDLEQADAAAAMGASGSASAVEGMAPLVDLEGSSVIEFEFDLSDEDDDQPPL